MDELLPETKLGKTEKEVLEYLSIHPNSNKEKVSLGLNKPHVGYVSNSINSLLRKGLIEKTDSYESSFPSKEEVSTYGLTGKGVVESLKRINDISKLLCNYQKLTTYHKQLFGIDKIFKDEFGDTWINKRRKMMDDALKAIQLLSSNNFDNNMIVHAIMGSFSKFVRSNVNSERRKRRILKKFSKIPGIEDSYKKYFTL